MSYGTPSPFDVPHSGYVHQKPQGVSCVTMALIFFGGSALVLVLVCGGAAVFLLRPPKASPTAIESFTFDDVPVPNFPDRAAATEIAPGVWKREISLGENDGYYDTPGHGGKLVV
jgi:hypothetical protein